MSRIVLRFTFGVALSLVLTGCATYPAPDVQLNLSVPQPPDAIASLFTEQARKCWQAQVTPVRTGLWLEAKNRGEGRLSLKVFRMNWGQGTSKSPFLVLESGPTAEGTSITLAEGPMICNFKGCNRVDLAQDLKKWLAGDRSCKDVGHSLLFDSLI